jgi:hypothetical protein
MAFQMVSSSFIWIKISNRIYRITPKGALELHYVLWSNLADPTARNACYFSETPSLSGPISLSRLSLFLKRELGRSYKSFYFLKGLFDSKIILLVD